MFNILVVEDTKMFSNMLRRRLETLLNCYVVVAESMAEAKEVLADGENTFDVALLDLTLPDSFDGEIVDFVAPLAPSIVLTGNVKEDVREVMWGKKIADYVSKDGVHNIDYVISLVKRICHNQNFKIMVVDDSPLVLNLVNKLLSVHRFPVITAESAEEAMDKLDEHPDIQLVLTDYNMPGMDGFDLTKALRDRFSKDQLCIIGMSAQGNNIMSARFIKNGANDFINKPFIAEELYCRVNHNIETLEYIHTIKDMSNRDYLTKSYNRRYFFESGNSVVKSSKTAALGMLDIDYFKKVNDTYGHDAGDIVLVKFAALLDEKTGDKGIAARLGGEEFSVLLTEHSPEQAKAFFEDLRGELEKMPIHCSGKVINVTVSIGVCTQCKGDLESMISAADKLLYTAKKGGRNRVVCE